MVDESLEIIVKAKNGTKRVFQEVSQGIDQTAAAADRATKRTVTFGEKTAAAQDKIKARQKVLNDLFGEFATKGAVFLGADLLARVAGFTNLMDGLNKGLDAAAKGLRGFFVDEDRERIRAATRDLSDLADEAERAELAARKLTRVQTGRVSELTFERQGFSAEDELELIGRLNEASEAFEEFRRVQERALQSTQSNSRLGIQSQAQREEAARIRQNIDDRRAALEEELQLIIDGFRVELDEREKASKIKAQRDKEELAADRAQAAARLKVQQDFVANVKRTRERLNEEARIERLASSALVAPLVQGGALIAEEAATLERRAQATKAQEAFTEAYTAALMKNAEAIQEAERKHRDAQSAIAEGWRNLIMEAAAYGQEIEDAPNFELGFTEGLQNARNFFGTLREEGQRLGEQAASGGFNAFRGFFNDVLSGAAKGEEAFKRFGQSVVATLTDLAAQFLSIRGLDLLFPGFGSLLQLPSERSRAKGGVETGGIQSFARGGIPGGGGVFTGDQLVRVGDNSSRREALLPLRRGPSGNLGVEASGSGGGTQITLNVGSLDPRNAAEVVLSAMPKIERALAQSLQRGRTRSLNVAVSGGANL